MSIDKHTTQAGFEKMTVDLDIICIKAGIPIDMHFFDDLFLEGVSEYPRDVYDYLIDNVKPIFQDKLSEYEFEGKRHYTYVVWEITKKIAVKILNHIIKERKHSGNRAVIEDWEIESKIEEWSYFDDGKKTFIVF